MVGNSFIEQEPFEQSVTDPTLGNGDGTYTLTFGNIRVLSSTDDVLGASFSGAAKVSVQSVSGNTVTLLFEEPDGAGAFQNAANATITGDLEVVAQG